MRKEFFGGKRILFIKFVEKANIIDRISYNTKAICPSHVLKTLGVWFFRAISD